MPVHTFTAGENPTAATLNSLAQALLFPTPVSASSTLAAGNLYIANGGGALVLTLPAATTAGQAIGVKLRGATEVTLNASGGGDVIYGPGANGLTSLTMFVKDSLICLVSDGTNWQVVGMAGFTGKVARVANTLGGAGITTVTTLITATASLSAWRNYRILAKTLLNQHTSTATVIAALNDSTAAVQIDEWIRTVPAGYDTAKCEATGFTPPADGARSFTFTLQTSAGTIDWLAATTFPAWVVIEDTGP